MLPNSRAFDHASGTDALAVVRGARRLEVSQFDFFRLAYRHWFGSDLNSKALEKIFAEYMFKEIVPPWVRHYCREALPADGRAAPGPDRLGVDHAEVRRTRLGPRSEDFAMMLLALTVSFLIVMGNERASIGRAAPGCGEVAAAAAQSHCPQVPAR